MILIVFGLPGVGKTFVGKILEKDFGFYLHDGDVDLPNEMRLTLSQNRVVTDEMRDAFFQNILKSLESLTRTHKNIVVTQTFIKEKYREWIREKFPEAIFMLVTALDEIREKRLILRHDYPIEYTRQMVANFEEPMIEYLKIDNSVDGEEHVREQLKRLIVNS